MSRILRVCKNSDDAAAQKDNSFQKSVDIDAALPVNKFTMKHIFYFKSLFGVRNTAC